jgi:hypothetical protein
MHVSGGGEGWFITPHGGEVTQQVAEALLARDDVQPQHDGLFPGIHQTYRLLMKCAMLEPDRDQLEIFVDAIFRHASSGFVAVRSFYEELDKPFRLSSAAVSDGLRFLMDVCEDDARRAAQFPKPVVFCPPLATFETKQKAGEKDIVEGLALSVELDKNPQQARATLEALIGQATVVVKSGGRWTNGNGEADDKLHLHWRLTKPAQGKNIAKLKKARDLATRLVGGDPTNKPVCHPIRWPGSWHRKAEPRLCLIEVLDADQEIDLDAVLDELIKASPQQSAKHDDEYTDKGEQEDWPTLVSDIITGKTYHPPLVSLAARLVGSNCHDGTIVKLLRAIMEASTAEHDERWQVRYDGIPRVVRTAREKYTKPPPQQAELAATAPLFDPWERYIVPEFPLGVLPPAVHKYVTSQSVVIGCDPAALAMGALTAISGALDHRFAVKMMRNGSWWEHPRLWTLLVGDPSRKKTPIINDVTRPLERHQNDLRRDYNAQLRDYEAAKEAGDKSVEKPDPPVRYVVWDTTTEKLGEILSRSEHGLLVKRDEFSGWIGQMEKYSNSSRGVGADRGFWLQAYDGGPHAVDRVSRGEIYIGNLSVSLIGGIQPARLTELHGLTSDGLLQRFLPVMMRVSTLPQDCASDDQDAYHALVYKLIKAEHQRLFLSDGALSLMNDLRAHLHRLEQVTGGLTDGLQAFIGKLPGVAGRLAVILHMIAKIANPQSMARDIEADTVAHVRTLIVDFIVPHAIEFYRTTEELTGGERLRKIASWIVTSQQKTVTSRDLIRNVACLRGVSVLDLQTVISPLVAAGWLEPEQLNPLNRTWTVSLAVAAQFERQRQIEEERKILVAELMGSPRKPASNTSTP